MQKNYPSTKIWAKHFILKNRKLLYLSDERSQHLLKNLNNYQEVRDYRLLNQELDKMLSQANASQKSRQTIYTILIVVSSLSLASPLRGLIICKRWIEQLSQGRHKEECQEEAAEINRRTIGQPLKRQSK